MEAILWRDADGDGYFNSGVDTLVDTQTTSADGTYLFTSIPASGTEDYFVSVDPDQAILSGYSATTDTLSRCSTWM